MSEGSPPLVIRPVRDDELAAVADLTVRAYVEGNGLAPDNPYLDQLRRVADRAAASPVLVGVRGDSLVGSVTVCPYASEWSEIAQPGEIELRALVVDPRAFGTGVGDALVSACLEQARRSGHDRLVLSVIEDNDYARSLYQRHGFTRDPTRDWSPVPGVELVAYVRDA